MNILNRGNSVSYSGVISVVLLYIVSIALLLVFAEQIISGLAEDAGGFGGVPLVLTIGFPVLLGFLVLVNLARLIRDRALRKPGADFRARLLWFFLGVVALSALPQGILAVNFTRNTLNIWYTDETGEALRGGQDLAIDAYLDQLDRLEDFANSRLFREVTANIARNPERVWNDIQQLNPSIGSVQVFTAELSSLFFAGPETHQLRPAQAGRVPTGSVSRDSAGGRGFLRIQTLHPGPDGTPDNAFAVLSVELPENFDRVTERLARSIETFSQVEAMRGTFMLSVILFYVLFSVPLLLLAVLVSFLLSDEIIRPLANLEEATRLVAEGDYSYRILTRSNDELGTLVDSFNQMIRELERSRVQMMQTQKVAAWQEIAQRMAHEIKNPLTPIRLSAERILRKYRDGAENFPEVLDRAVNNIIREVNGLNDLLAEFRSFSRMPQPHLQRTAVHSLVSEVAAGYTGGHEATIDLHGVPEDLEVEVDARQIQQALANLFKNAMESSSEHVHISVRADLVMRGRNRYCRLQISDNGPGIPPERQAQVFHPYFTTKPDGTGLGLAIVERIIVDHHGQIWFETESGQGTTFFIDLPTYSTAGSERKAGGTV
ncbi:MAG: ATP-binding protein [Spirochaetaceae bacterium]